MIKLTQSFMKKGYKLINMHFHSTTLKHGISPYTWTKQELDKFIQRIKEFLTFTKEAEIESIRLSDGISLLDAGRGKGKGINSLSSTSTCISPLPLKPE